MMQVLLWMPGAEHVPGGHRVQLDKTAAALCETGVNAAIEASDDADLDRYDLVHGFGLTLEQIRRCRQKGVPVVLSTIYWSKDYTSGLTHGLWRPQAVLSRARTGLSLMHAAILGRHHEKCESLVNQWQYKRVRYEMADLLLPNSEAEAEQIRVDLGVTTPMHVVPNAVDPERFTLPAKQAEGERRGVLYAGRFEPHKNQLGLIEAMRGSDLPVTLVGPAHPHHQAYYEKCQRRATGNIRIEPGVPHDELPMLYQRHKVHVLPSWFETTGLVSLEAALCGSNIVTTNRGFARDYFEDLAWYCDPAQPQSIRDAVEAAHAAPFVEALRERVLSRYTWRHTAEATVAGYRQAFEAKQSATLQKNRSEAAIR